ncbi:hypothetical protein GOQ27_11425 [Clostridium sp. D2Q-11]|uniref:Uncharacterized protein n=1 Tax=Anaeromonas frigoriresistens TaxID=2683708 RepID=A0A942Z719_9FIRM|nr:hypothetical protein [Anaeromonas frigoriresistens]MBS4539076.1 hypothetical protein [Anaeromonas frigoriresistens]
MKVINETIDMIAIFEKDTGNIKPFKFKYKDNKIKIQKVIKTYEEKLAGNRRIVFVCLHNEKDVYEIKYEMDTARWYLFKK